VLCGVLVALILSVEARGNDAETTELPALSGVCDRGKAEGVFRSGMAQYGRRNWEEAIPYLEKAVAACPNPGARPWIITVPDVLFGQYPYLPFFYLGRCHISQSDLPNALRSFYLSSCVEEPKRGKEETKDLATLTKSCRERLASKKQPKEHPDFRDGLAAARRQSWEEAAEKMFDALQVWEQEGRPTVSYGRWVVPYRPRFRLAEALCNLGCHRAAADQLEEVLLKDLDAEENKLLEALKPECKRKVQTGPKEEEACQRWRCWLRQGQP
jgi:hypothetical protein